MSSLPNQSTDITDQLYTTTSNADTTNSQPTSINENDEDQIEGIQQATSFVPNLPTTRREMEEVRSLLHLGEGRTIPNIQWPSISTSPINEYTTEGLFAMAFPTLYPQGKATFKQQRIKDVKLHEYAQHLLRFHDNRFGQHP